MTVRRRSLLLAATFSLGLLLFACTGEEAAEDELPQEEGATTGEEAEPPAEDDGVAEAAEEASDTSLLTSVGAPGLARDVGDLSLPQVFADDEGWVTVGSVAAPGERDQAVFAYSEDGEDWELDELPAPDGVEHRSSAVARIDGTTYVIGANRVGSEYHLVLWAGEPGSWELTELDDQLGTAPSLSLTGAVSTEDDHLLVVGSETDLEGDRSPRIWRVRPDGTAESILPFEGAGRLEDVTVWDGALVAIGGSGDDAARPAPTVVRSDDDGASWAVVQTSGFDDGQLLNVQVVDDELTIGGRTDASGSGSSEVWTSSDGETWEARVDQNRGTSHVRRVHRLDGQLFALGTWLGVSDPVDERFAQWSWPLSGDRGTFGASAQHDGRVVAVASRDQMPLGLATATDPGQWQAIDLAGELLDTTTGVSDRRVDGLATDGDQVLLVGREIVVDERQARTQLLAAGLPDMENSTEGIADGAAFTSALHDEAEGWIAVGFDVDEEVVWNGTRAARSQDGRSWTDIEVEGGSADRVVEVLRTDDRILAIGLGWVDGTVEGSHWHLTDDGFEQVDVEGLGEWVGLSGCARGEVVLLHAYRGGSARAMAVSVDGGDSFEVVEDGPLSSAQSFSCDVDDDGAAVIVSLHPTGANQVHRYDIEAGEWEPLEAATEGTRVSIDRPYWAPETGWVLLGTQVQTDDDEALVRVSRDLQDWSELAFDGDPLRSTADHAVATGDTLYVQGTVEEETEVWSVPLEDLP